MDTEQLEVIAQELCDVFEIYAPPVPIELMLRRPKKDMWEEVDVAKLSGNFMRPKDRFSPRMSMSRLLVRHIAYSDWGKQHGLEALARDGDMIHTFARILLMPREMVLGLTKSMRNAKTMSTHFEVPESDAEERLRDLA